MEPWDYNTDTYFQSGERVRIGDTDDPKASFTFGGLSGCKGTIAGIAFDHVIKTYIVILDDPVQTPWLPVKEHRCVIIPNGYLRRV